MAYKNKSHEKTMDIINEMINYANNLKKDNPNVMGGIEHLTIDKYPMTEYHLGYIIEQLQENGFDVEFTNGINFFHFHISWGDNHEV